MLHEFTDELLTYFIDNVNVATFKNVKDMAEKIVFYLKEEDKRSIITQNGYELVHDKHMSTNRARFIIDECYHNNIL